MTHRAKALLTALLLAGLSSFALAAGDAIEIRNAWIKQLPPVVPVRAGYVTIINHGKTPLRLVGAEGADFDRVEMHETQTRNGTMKMVRHDSFELPPGATLELKPGGKHLMLFDPARPLMAGDETLIELEFDDGSRKSATFRIKP